MLLSLLFYFCFVFVFVAYVMIYFIFLLEKLLDRKVDNNVCVVCVSGG